MSEQLNNDLAHDLITAEFTRFKGHQTSRAERISFADQLVEDYFKQRGELPHTLVLDRLATLILQDELADRTRIKMSATEYPLLSNDQERRRIRRERTLAAISDVGTDGQSHRIQTRDSNRKMKEMFYSL